MVGRDVVTLAALLVEPEPPPALLPEVVLPPHADDRAHPREAVEHHRDERPVAQTRERARVDRLEEPAGFGRREHRRRALGDHVLRSPDGRRRVHGEDLADDEPVAEHADGRQVLLDRGRRAGVGPDVGRHVQRRDRLERQPPRIAPGQELPHGPPVRRARPPVRDLRTVAGGGPNKGQADDTDQQGNDIILTITTTHQSATNLGQLLHKKPPGGRPAAQHAARSLQGAGTRIRGRLPAALATKDDDHETR